MDFLVLRDLSVNNLTVNLYFYVLENKSNIISVAQIMLLYFFFNCSRKAGK